MVSFIVPAHNEAAWVDRYLAAIRSAAQAIDAPWEVLTPWKTRHSGSEEEK